jgi:hypothetical protein
MAAFPGAHEGEGVTNAKSLRVHVCTGDRYFILVDNCKSMKVEGELERSRYVKARINLDNLQNTVIGIEIY